MIRAFVAVDISPATVQRIATTITELNPKLPSVRWVAPANFHLTIKFLGDIETHQVEAVSDALKASITPFPRCTINAKGLGVFPGLRQPKVLWVGFIGDELTELAKQIDAALLPLGFTAESRVFTPHLTIGRWRKVERGRVNLKAEQARWRDYEFGSTLVDRVILFQSVLKPSGAIYSQLNVIEFKHPAN